MCENPDIASKTALRKLEHRLLIGTQKSESIEVDGRMAYFKGKAISKELWRLQALEMNLPADSYLDVAALARNEAGMHIVRHHNQEYLVEVNGIVHSMHGPHREIVSITAYKG